MAQEFLRSRTLVEFYDEVVIPALQLAERDRHAALLNEHQEAEVMESALELMEELGQRQQSSAGGSRDNGSQTEQTAMSPVFCIGVRDHADETAAMMLGQLLTQHEIAAEVGSLNLLASEAVERIEQLTCRLVVLTVLPPLGTRNARYLCKRIRRQHPHVRIVVALFQSELGHKDEASLLDNGANVVVTSLVHAVSEVRRSIKQIARQDQHAPLP
jgi:hypothetical protein